MFVLIEKRRLRESLFRFPKVAQPYPDQPIALMLAKGHSLSQTERNPR